MIAGAIVNLSTQKYQKGRERLINSIYTYGNAAVNIFSFFNESDVGSPLHTENPYAFKIYSIEKILSLGYRKILWLDGSVYAIKPIAPIFDWIAEKGFFMEAAGHWAGSWANDNCLQYFGISREEAMKIPMFAAGYVGFDFDNPISVKFFIKWRESMLAGCFKGSWENHRHDMTCGSIIAYQMGLVDKFSGGGNFFAYIGEPYGTPKESVIFYLEGGT